MSPETAALLTDYGMDVDRTVARFAGNERMMLMFLRELGEDETVPQIKKSKERGDMAAFKAAVHSLKGTSGNLGLTPLYDAASALMTALRAGDEAECERLYPLMLGEFDRAAAIMARIAE